jgi:hypothetical protein
MMNLLAEAGAKFNTTQKAFASLMIPYSFINQLNSISFFINSSILTGNEGISLTQMLNYPSEGKLIYKATRDGFSASSFHYKCDNISNTVSIIKTRSNSVFGGFTSASWLSNNYWFSYDANAFIFSLRREGSQNNQRLNVRKPEYAIRSYYDYYGPIFGTEINVLDNSNQNNYSYSILGDSYQLPKNITYGSQQAVSYLAGNYYWQTTEIEVYQLFPFEPFSVSFLHNGCLLFQFYKFYLNFNLIQ